uniref:Uncharacterized protein n=1 Tax=Anguilla anguilla TaxID=7936 RepID=A0A0E9W196_ANGAN
MGLITPKRLLIIRYNYILFTFSKVSM